MKNLLSSLLLAAALLVVFAGHVFGQGCDCASDTEAPKISLNPDRKWEIGSVEVLRRFSIEGDEITIYSCNGSRGAVSFGQNFFPPNIFFSKDDVVVSDNCSPAVEVSLEFVGFKIDTSTLVDPQTGQRVITSIFYQDVNSNTSCTADSPPPLLRYIARDSCGNSSQLEFKFRTTEGWEKNFFTRLADSLQVDTVVENGTYYAQSFSDIEKIMDETFGVNAYYTSCNASTVRSKGFSKVGQKSLGAAGCDIYELVWTACFTTNPGVFPRVCDCPFGNPDTTRIFVKTGAGCEIQTDCPGSQTIELPRTTASVPVHWQIPDAVSFCDGSAPQPCDPAPLNAFQTLGRRGNSQYYFSNFRKNWADAQALCRSLGGNLASITSPDENQFIAQAVGKQEAVWIGLSDQKQEGTFEWADGSPLGYSNWAAGQPDNVGSEGEDFALLEGWLPNGQWTDQNRWVEKPFILEIPCPGVQVEVVQTAGPPNGSLLGAGTYPITYTFTDSCGNISTCGFEVEVTPPGGAACPLVNHAFQKNATQSSTWIGASGSRAVDGNANGNFWQDFSVAHTTWETNPWWQVDLGEQRDIQQINIWGRSDCCMAETSGFYVLIAEKPMPQSSNLNDLLADPTVEKHFVADVATRPTVVPTAGTTGRFVRLQAAKATFLGLAEVEVLGCEKTPNPAEPPAIYLRAGKKIEEKPFAPQSDFELMPNPTGDFVDIFLGEPRRTAGELVIFNQLGMPVLNRHFDDLEDGKIRLLLRDLGFQNGQYFVGVQQAGFRPIFKRMVFLNEG